MRIATGEEGDPVVDDGKDPAAKSLVARRESACGCAQQEVMQEIVKPAAAKRWKR